MNRKIFLKSRGFASKLFNCSEQEVSAWTRLEGILSCLASSKNLAGNICLQLKIGNVQFVSVHPGEGVQSVSVYPGESVQGTLQFLDHDIAFKFPVMLKEGRLVKA